MITPKRAAGGVVAVALVLLGFYLVVPRDFYTGTNAVRTRGFLIEVERARQACFDGLKVPAGTGRVEFELRADTRQRIAYEFAVGGAAGMGRAEVEGQQKVALPILETPAEPDVQTGRICVEAETAGPVRFGGVPGVKPGETAPTIDGEDTLNRAAIWYRPPAGEQASAISRLPTLFERMALFRASWVGPWTYWLLFLVVVPALAAAGIWLVVRPERRRLALLVGLLGFANAAVWAHVTPTFNTPDESEHFAYLQSLAERGEAPSATSTNSPWSEQERLAIDMTRILDGNETADGKPPWLASEEDTYRRLGATNELARDDGGGPTPATVNHSPVFYVLGLPAYFAAGGELLDKVTAARLVSALLGGLIAACAVLLVLELAPRRRGLAAAAGVAVAFQPMFAFMAGSYNNDMGVNAAAAVITLLLVRLLKRGFHWPTALALGVLVGLAPLLKGTGYALFPPTLIALVLAAYRYRAHWRRVVAGVALVVGAIVAVTLGWSELVAQEVGREAFTTPNGGAPVAGTSAAQQPGGAFNYFWQVFLPQLPTTQEHWVQSWPAYDIFGIRGWGAFGWYAVSWHHDVYWLIMIVLLGVTGLGLAALVRRSEWVCSNVPELLVLLAVVGTVLGVMIVAYYTPSPVEVFPQQGRYVFPALIALAALFVGATTGAGRAAPAIRVGLATGVVCLGYASLWLVLTRFYFAA